jgi:NAD+ synthetase
MLDHEEIARVRSRQPLLADLETEFRNLLESRDEETITVSAADGDRAGHSAQPHDSTSHAVLGPSAASDPMEIDPVLTEQWLVTFLREELVRRRGFQKGIVGLSGGVDSSVTAVLAARALEPEHVIGVRMPYRTSSSESLMHAEELANQLGIQLVTVDITAAVDAFVAATDEDTDPTRRGNVMARMRMITLFDLSAKHHALPLGTGNKTERLLGYYTWHGDDAPPVNPLGDLFKTQVLQLARHLEVPDHIVRKPASADLVIGQTDEQDLGIAYDRADHILHWLLHGIDPEEIVTLGFEQRDVELVHRRLETTHWKRRLPTVAMLSDTTIGESYLRPVDY